ncbi:MULTISPECIES: Hsp33 family molecular chaperone HslO [Methylomonas]|uniref:Hsp33 family molecular chaperone HslO n=1 Tax=Methylomonas TaxID=416 RepID=UPI001231C476|nr:Hsp33 family molecular chaperone HslO [Methylomonas rhizoryzae]
MKQQDCLLRFLFENLGVRGEWVRLQQSWQQAKQHQCLAGPLVESQLGQALAAVTLLSATIKYKGTMILQVQGSGEVRAIVAQATHDRTVRGLVRSAETVQGTSLAGMMGENARLVLTIESEQGEPYQGIVGVQEESLAAVLRSYFTQSEQLRTRLWLFADQHSAVGLLLQELPDEKSTDEDWQRIEILADTVTAEEMFNLDCEPLLHRLFHQEQVRIYAPEPVMFRCGCSRVKIGSTLYALGRPELEAILHDHGNIEVDCQFCGSQYRFDNIDIENLLANSGNDNESPTRH